MEVNDLKVLEVVAALEGCFIVNRGNCPHHEGNHDKSSNTVLVNVDNSTTRRYLIPCKRHLEDYLASRTTWKIVDF